jgi:hypothetical protein
VPAVSLFLKVKGGGKLGASEKRWPLKSQIRL